MKIEDGDRPRLLEATESAMRTVDGLLDPRLLERLAAEAGVDPEVIAHRWGTGVSLIADVVSDKSGIATPGWPQAVHFDGATPRSILTALASGLAASLDGDNLTQAALSQVIASPVVRRVWSAKTSSSGPTSSPTPQGRTPPSIGGVRPKRSISLHDSAIRGSC